jgi:malate synthase
MSRTLEIRDRLGDLFPDVYTPEALAALAALAPLEVDRRALMAARIARRAARMRERRRLAFLDPETLIPRTAIRAGDAREGRFTGSDIPADLVRQWIQGTGPATRPRSSTEQGLRNVAYALLSGADGWMFDGEDALGQVDTMSLDNQRNLKLALAGDASSRSPSASPAR